MLINYLIFEGKISWIYFRKPKSEKVISITLDITKVVPWFIMSASVMFFMENYLGKDANKYLLATVGIPLIMVIFHFILVGIKYWKIYYKEKWWVYKSFGNIYGEVVSVSIDTVTNNDQMGYYLVECSIENKKFFDRHGNEATMEIGMVVKGRIIVREIRIIDFLLEKLDFIVR